jgi:DNA helicase-2/ATP-dependent DNA helicase PcrA
MRQANKVALRPAQQKIMAYRSGKMGVSAVPGSGKTWTLSLLASEIVASGQLADDQEVLVVTLVNSAVDNFYQRVSSNVQEKGLFPYMGYRVRTLHGLAHDIVRERPDLVNLEDRFQILDEREAANICKEAAQTWLHTHPYDLDDYFDSEIEEGRQDWVRREQLLDLVSGIALSVIRYAKDLRLSPERLRERLDQTPISLPLAEMGNAIYYDYQRSLAYRGAVDFDDLIRLALQAIESDQEFLDRLHHRWPYILEDEAQDSSRLQEEILSLLVGENGNWVRVGDTNQAIYETFTTADPCHLRNFLHRKDVTGLELPNSGRSTLSIINLANYLVEWTQNDHPVKEARDALRSPPLIELTPLDDPQSNPIDDPTGVHLVMRQYTPQEEILAVTDSISRWLPEHQDWTVAVLTPRNTRAFELVDELRRRDIPYEDGLLRSSSSTRYSAGVLGNLLSYLSEPGSARKLSTVYKVWRRTEREDEQENVEVERIATQLSKITRVEDFIWPSPEVDLLMHPEMESMDQEMASSLDYFHRLVRRWQSATLLPIDQMVLTLAQDLLHGQVELALAYKLAVLLRQASQAHPSWRLPELSEELGVIARNERRFIGFSEEDAGFDPIKYVGKVIISTVHKAKGLEWDRVYLMSVNNYDFPSAQENDSYIAEKWFLRDGLNLEAETLAQLTAVLSTDEYKWYQEGEATQRARLDYVRERLRLLYVGITRARKDIVITWNTGRKGALFPSIPLLALYEFWGGREKNAKE